MSEFVFKLPDLGEGMVEAEIVEWYVKPGDVVTEGDIIADLMTDKANVDVPAPVSGRVLRTSGQPGDAVPVGSELIAFELDVEAPAGSGSGPTVELAAEVSSDVQQGIADPADKTTTTNQLTAVKQPAALDRTPQPAPPGNDAGGRLLSSPAIRKRAKEAGVDLNLVRGSGPKGRILAADLAEHLASGPSASNSSGFAGSPARSVAFQEHKVIGIRRVIAERLAQSKREIPHFAYVEEIDVTDLERLRAHLNELHGTALSILPFVATALLLAIDDFPQCNSHYNNETGMLRTFRGVHLGIAAQTPDGLKVPVVRDAHLKNIWQLSEAISQMAQRARSGESKPAELTGSTITLTSLGKLGGIASTPIINRPEVAVVGVNRVSDRAVVVEQQIQVRTMVNLSSSFDHRFVDGYDAAAMIQLVKRYLEHPATMFIGAPG